MPLLYLSATACMVKPLLSSLHLLFKAASPTPGGALESYLGG